MRFRLHPDCDEAAFLAADKKVQEEFAYAQLGLQRRTTARGRDGNWIVIDLWRSAQDADDCDARWEADPVAQHFMSFVDHVSVDRYDQLDLLLDQLLLDEDQPVALGVGELPDDEAGRRTLRPHQAGAAQALGLGQGSLDVRHPDVERDVTGIVRHLSRCDAARDAIAVGVGVAFASNRTVLQWIVGVDLPPE